MTKIFRKSLALVITLAMCLTAVTACFVVSAEDPTDTITFSSPAVTEGATEITVTLDIASQGFLAQLVTFNYDSRLGVPTATIPGDAQYDIETNLATAGTVKYILDGWGATDIYAATITLTFTAPTEAGFAADDYAFTFVSAEAANDEEVNINFTPAGTWGITVAAAQQECEHDWEIVSATPATGSDNSANTEISKGSITLKCSKCDEEVVKPVNYNYYTRTSVANIRVESETLLNFGARYERDFGRMFTGVNITDGYIVLDQVRAGTPVETKTLRFADCEDTIDSSSYKIYNATIGLVAFAMKDDVTSHTYAYDATTDAWYSGIAVTYSVSSLVLDVLKQAGTTNLQKTMLVNLLNYGAAAQTYFNQNTLNLANADITAYQSFATTPRAYNGADWVLNTPSGDVKEFFFYKFTALLESKITNRAYFRLPPTYSDINTPVDMTNYSVEVTYTDFTGETVTETYTSDVFKPEEGKVNRYYVDVQFKAADLRSQVSFVVKDNGVAFTSFATCSMEYLVKNVLGQAGTTQAQATMLNNMMAFSDAAYDYLSTK